MVSNDENFFPAPCDLWLFPRFKMPVTGERFNDIKTTKTNAMSIIKAIPKSGYEDYFRKLKHYWERVLQSNGNYFEGCQEHSTGRQLLRKSDTSGIDLV